MKFNLKVKPLVEALTSGSIVSAILMVSNYEKLGIILYSISFLLFLGVSVAVYVSRSGVENEE